MSMAWPDGIGTAAVSVLHVRVHACNTCISTMHARTHKPLVSLDHYSETRNLRDAFF
jgi:hypothetical protein